jgi:2',3'-cyclic-nucleotide 2'-phosphodiesterase / 3'-nucleotidase / 5'-nucleotidase
MLKTFKKPNFWGGNSMLKTKKSKVLSLVMTAAMIFSNLSGLDGLKTVKAVGTDKVFDLVEITDFHGTLLDSSNNQVAAVLANRIKNVQNQNPDTIVIGGGDLYQGSAISNMLKGVPVKDFLNNIGMETTTLGNHEFDWGLNTVTTTTMNGANYNIICSNLYAKNPDGSNGARLFDPYKIVEKDGVKIAFVGAITNETPTIVMPAFIDQYNFTDVATEVNKVAKEIKDSNLADVVVALIHEGDNLNNSTGPIFDIASKLTNVNAVFGGHSHSKVYAKASNGMPVYIANSAGKGYIDVKLTVSSDGTVSIPTPSAADYVALDNADGYKTATPVVDNDVKALVDTANNQLLPTTGEVIGHNSAAVLTRKQFTSQGNPTGTFGSSFIGNWAADATRNAVGAQVGMQNNGGLRIDIPVGDITVGTMWQFMPFDNTIYKVSMNKSDLKAILEQAVMNGGKGIQISGVKFNYDSTKISGSRVVDITWEDGSAITDTETITVAAPDFVATGGDGFTAFKPLTTGHPELDSHILARDAFINDLKAHLTSDPSLQGTTANRVNNLAKVASIVGTSDLHGAIYPLDYNTGLAANVGLARVSTYVNNLRASNPNTMLIDNGDTIQGTPLVYYYNMIDQTTEYPMMKVMGAMGYDSWTLGNHEFNYGLTTLNRIIADASKEKINVLSANTYNLSGTNYVNPYYTKTFTINGKAIKVGILGLTTKTIPSWEDPAHYAGLQFNDLVTEAQKWVPVLKSQEKCDVVIVSAHTGTSNVSDTIPENQADLIAKQVTGIDVILAGHAHTGKIYSFTNPDGKVVPVVEPKNGDGIFSQIDLNINADGEFVGVNANNVDISKDTTIVADPAILAIADPYQAKTLEYTNTVIGQSTAVFEGAKQLTEPSSIMELVNKVQMNAAKSQLSIAAPLSLTAKVPQGDIKRQDIMGVYVYENFLYGVNLTGKQLKNWLEWSVRYYKQTISASDPIVKDPTLNIADYNLDQLYGATYDIDLTQPACTTDSNGLVTSGNRIRNLRINGVLIKDTDTFKVAVNNYRYNGGGGFMAAAGLTPGSAATIAATYYDSAKALGDDGQVRNMMFKYVQDNKIISPTNSSNWKISTTAVVQQVDVTGITLNKTSLNLEVGKTETLTAGVLPSNATNKNVTWTSSDVTIATVKDGVVTAVKAGNVTITAAIGSVKVECIVKVNAVVAPKPVVNDTAKVVEAIKIAPEKSTTIVDISTNTNVAKEIFNEIVGKDKTVTFQKDGVSWTFNGLDIKPELIKDLDLSLKTVTDELKAKETAKAKAIVGKDVAIASFSFTYEGKLPGKADVRIFLGKDWANRTVNVLRYFADKNTYEVAQKEVAVDADGYMVFTTEHCSDYFVIDNTAIASSKLPQTGSPVDFTMLVDFGALIAALGVAMLVYDRKKKKINA